MTDAPTSFSLNENEAVIQAARSRDQGREAVIATDVSGSILYWNEHAASLYGWTATEVLGRNILDVTPTRGSGDAAAQIMEDMRGGEGWTGEFIVKHRDGTPMIVHVSNFPVHDGDSMIGVVGVSRRSPQKTSSRGTSTPPIAD